MKLTLNYIDTFQYHGPYRITIVPSEEVVSSIQTAESDEQLKKALSTFLFGGGFISHMKETWKWPLLTQEEAGSSCDTTPEDLLSTICRWFERELSIRTIEVFRATDKSPNEHTAYIVHEEVIDGLEDQHLHITIEHDGLANPMLKSTYLVPTEEERKASQDDEYWQDSWRDDD